MLAVGGEDGRTHVSLHLSAAERTRPAPPLPLLQRGRRSVPAIMPMANNVCSASDSVATSESSEAMSGGAWSILEEDRMLGLCAEVRHVAVLHERGSAGVAERVSTHAREKRRLELWMQLARARDEIEW
jgi:hypothetical protein